MKAAVLKNYGAPENFVIKDVPVPEIQDGEILVKNLGSSVNPVDTLVRKGLLRLVSGLFGEPVIGADFAGVVAATKSNLFNIGDEVFGFKNAAAGHTYAEYVAVNAKEAVLKPQNISFTEAASVPLVALTAYQGLVDKGHLQSGQQVLINGCTGGVGVMAVQIAKHVGAVVSGTCSAGSMQLAKELGCDTVYDYKKDRIPADGRFDLILDTAAQLNITEAEKSLTPTGLLVTTKPPSDNLTEVVSSAIDLLRPRMKMFMVTPVAKDLEIMRVLIEQHIIRPVVSQTYPLHQIADAHSALEKGGINGKIAIEIGDSLL